MYADRRDEGKSATGRMEGWKGRENRVLRKKGNSMGLLSHSLLPGRGKMPLLLLVQLLDCTKGLPKAGGISIGQPTG